MIKKILVPFDGSKYSVRAFMMATEIATKFDSKIAAVTVIPKYYHTRSLYANLQYEETILRKQRAAAKRSLEEVKLIAKKQGIKIDIDVLESNSIVKQIVAYVKSKKIDLIVMGSHGRGKFDKVLLGSVSNGVMQRAKCSVMIIK